MHAHTHTHTHSHRHRHTHTQTDTDRHTHTHTHTHKHTHRETHTHTHTHTHTDTHTDKHTHKHAHTLKCKVLKCTYYMRWNYCTEHINKILTSLVFIIYCLLFIESTDQVPTWLFWWGQQYRCRWRGCRGLNFLFRGRWWGWWRWHWNKNIICL